jgi:hypothetical protein
LPGDSVLLDNDRVRVVRRVIRVNTEADIASHTPSVIVFLTPGQLLVKDQKAPKVEIKPGTFFFSGPADHSRIARNESSSDLVAVTFFFK